MIKNLNKFDRNTHGCLLAGSGRGDCEHYIGLPEHANKSNTDVYGRPHDWCEICWRGEQIKRLKRSLFNLCENYGGFIYAQNCVSEALKNPII